MARLSAGARRCARHWALPARHPPRVLNDHRPIAPARRTDSTVALTLIPEVWVCGTDFALDLPDQDEDGVDEGAGE